MFKNCCKEFILKTLPLSHRVIVSHQREHCLSVTCMLCGTYNSDHHFATSFQMMLHLWFFRVMILLFLIKIIHSWLKFFKQWSTKKKTTGDPKSYHLKKILIFDEHYSISLYLYKIEREKEWEWEIILYNVYEFKFRTSFKINPDFNFF